MSSFRYILLKIDYNQRQESHNPFGKIKGVIVPYKMLYYMYGTISFCSRLKAPYNKRQPQPFIKFIASVNPQSFMLDEFQKGNQLFSATYGPISIPLRFNWIMILRRFYWKRHYGLFVIKMGSLRRLSNWKTQNLFKYMKLFIIKTDLYESWIRSEAKVV